MPRVRATAAILVLSAVMVAGPGARSADLTICAYGGPTPGFKAIRFELPEGTGYIGIEPHGARTARPVSGQDNWHLAQGLIVVNADTLELEAYRVESNRSSPRRLVVAAEGVDPVVAPVSAPDGPFDHITSRPRSGLPAGTYYAIGFGTDGTRTLPNEWWGFDLRILGRHSCTPVGQGETFEFDQSHFSGGMHAYAGVAGVAEGISYEMETPRQLMVGLLDVAVQLAGEAQVEHIAPEWSRVVDDTIVPFASIGGTHTFNGSYAGVFPMILGAGVTIDMP